MILIRSVPTDSQRTVAKIKDLNPISDHRSDNLQSSDGCLAFNFRNKSSTLDQSLANEYLYKMPKPLGSGFVRLGNSTVSPIESRRLKVMAAILIREPTVDAKHEPVG